MKKGFIATTLIYSFFLIFCAVLLSYIGISMHNKNLLNKANENIRNDIAEKIVGNIDIGSFVTLDLSTSLVDTKDVDWIVFNNSNGVTELVSSAIIFSNDDIDYIKNNVQSFHNACLSKTTRILSHDDLYTIIKNNVSTIRMLKSIVNVDNANNSIDYLLVNGNNVEKYTFNEPSSDTISLNEYISAVLADSNISTYNTGDNMNVRLVITIPNNIKIIGGSGSSSNPYRISTSTCYEDMSLVNKIIGNGYDNKNNYTIPGVDVSIRDEGLRTTQDDYGISYYFRGTVDNNYLLFAGKCWRIVRITGNGAIKLILYNNNNSNCNISDNSGYIMENSQPILSAYNANSNSNTYIGFMYNVNGTNYTQTHTNTNDSTILQKLKVWYDGAFSNEQKNKLADVIWCNDKSINTSLYNGYGRNTTYYLGEKRGNDPTNNPPSLICPSSNDTTKKLSKFTGSDTINGNGSLKGYKVGILTADEVAYAGLSGNNNTNNPASSYLLQGASLSWWTLTPRYFNTNAFIYYVNNVGRLNSTNANVNNTISIRPSIALNANTLVTGAGTINDPYVVQ